MGILLSKKDLKKIVDRKFFRRIHPVEIKGTESLYDKNINPSISFEPHTKIIHFTLPNGTEVNTLWDDNFEVHKHTNEVAFDVYSHWKQRKICREKEMINRIKGDVYKVKPKVKIKKFLKNIKNLNVEWRDVVYSLVDGTDGVLSDKIKYIMLAGYLPIPFNNMYPTDFWQKYNNHSILVTPPQVGKTGTVKRMLGYGPSQSTCTVPGLFGTFDTVTGRIQEGSLSGKGLFAIDEFPKYQSESHDSNGDLVGRIFTYMSSGEVVRTMAIPVRCLGTKCLHFYGNVPYSELSEKSLSVVLHHLTSETFDAFGARVGHLLYTKNVNYIGNVVSNENWRDVNKIRYVIETMCNHYQRKIMALLYKGIKDFVQVVDDDYVSYFEEIQSFCEHRNVKVFLNGFKHSWKRIKFGAFKCAILLNLDRVCCDNIQDCYVRILTDAKELYIKFKKYNMDSFEFLFETKKKHAFKLFIKGKSYKESIYELNISKTSWYRWKKEWEKNRKK